MQGQYEQHCNAAALKMLGVPVLRNLKHKQVKKIQEWLDNDATVAISFPDETEEIVETVLEQAAILKQSRKRPDKINSASKFRRIVLQKIFN